MRLDLNVPIKEGVIQETFRLDAVVPTIGDLVDKGAKVIIVSHAGSDGRQTLAPMAAYLSRQFNTVFFPDLNNLFHIENLRDGEVAILENIRRDAGEMKNSKTTAKWLASLADIYVNEAFSVSHRNHASVVGVPQLLPSYFGPLFVEEYNNLSKVFLPQKPFLFILGGLKVGTKIPLLKKFVKKADTILVGGALANVFYKKLGFEVGQSVCDPEMPAGLAEFLKSENVHLPLDVVTETGGDVFVRLPDSVRSREAIVDAGPETVTWLKDQIADAKFILWNGPLGNFEKGFNKGTLEVARAVAKSKAYTVVGGGDTVSAVADLKLEKDFDFVSTAGGAMLDFLATGTLPGIEAIIRRK